MAISALNHDGQLWISLGRSRKETSWQSKQVAWSQLLKKFSETNRTNETYKEYMSMSKDLQSEKKDVGGFVGGVITGSGGAGAQRLKKNIATRSMITLDIDYLTTDFWGTYEMFFDNAAALYSTHKHSPESPRLRLIMPLDRPYFPDQYEAISRKVAELLNIECFDDSTFQRERLMYWPSTSKDGIFEFKYQDGPFLIGTEMLRRYYDWKDTSQWPVSSRVSAEHRQLADKQGDPMEKPGVIGAFCRAYSISEAIDLFLGDTYSSTAQENRYTYAHGSTAGGLILYDDKFAYSHHGTDPVSGRLVNAFDLVRLHKYGNEDANINPETPIQKRPSYEAMRSWASKDKSVITELDVVRISELFHVMGKQMTQEDLNWRQQLKRTKDGLILQTMENVRLCLETDPQLKGKFYFDAFRNRDTIAGPLPWNEKAKLGDPFTDKDDSKLRWYLETFCEMTGADRIRDAFRKMIDDHEHHPVREFVKATAWDQMERLDSLFIDYFGAADTEYNRAITRKTFVGAIARIMQPGVKFDNMLVLVGAQGIGKSEFIERLARPWYSDSLGQVDNLGKVMEQLQGVWIVEVGELASFSRSDAEAIKIFITKKEDRYRPAYGRRTEEFPRQCIFIGTTNKEEFLNDPTGDRRFWPIYLPHNQGTKSLYRHLHSAEIKQLWAEAYHRWLDNEPMYLSNELEKIGREIKKDHTETDYQEGIIREFLASKIPCRWKDMGAFDRYQWWLKKENAFNLEEQMTRVTKISPIEIWTDVLGLKTGDASYFKLKKIREYIAKVEGWKPSKIRTRSYGQQRGFININGDKDEDNFLSGDDSIEADFSG